MAILSIITAPDRRLKVKSKPVETVDDDIRRFLDDMLETMYQAPGIGLSAVQVGVAKNLITVDVSRDDEDNAPLFLINPEIVEYSEQIETYNEGCLSLPEYFADLPRPEAITLNYLDYDGAQQQLQAEGLLSRCIQHEMDHLKGKLFVDYLSAVKRGMILRKLDKARRQKVSA
ncbi:MAG: peptide deformylase [Rhodospirillaceae bacterium]|jgi:peptide deformylase|nr:peptide deformylase [Rhodospirillaceae bacterium]MBT4491357.1 peptide deformylase [Rhodospirillaceae bacterium]MBT5192931.1 peptide deformylase [Rhodospirillaceae bacterium]MBT5898792.1 peptide deformylase [Rhodospirillaceae bacterium]MBT6431291.1 peptide deformylase [Rhodospirillaceae bacterium]